MTGLAARFLSRLPGRGPDARAARPFCTWGPLRLRVHLEQADPRSNHTIRFKSGYQQFALLCLFAVDGCLSLAGLAGVNPLFVRLNL